MVPALGQIIREIQQTAAALPTDALRHEIEMNLEVQDAAIRQYCTISPGGTVEDLIIANSTVMVSVLTTALYVRELTTRPVVHSMVVISHN